MVVVVVPEQVDAVVGDAADEATIKGLVERALAEEGSLDVFFANAGTYLYNRRRWSTLCRV
jgi:NAD(P)-dependent dehydrogenase (short-subunit alcohol dehydrogenase family)